MHWRARDYLQILKGLLKGGMIFAYDTNVNYFTMKIFSEAS